jgi:hypothetical protein
MSNNTKIDLKSIRWEVMIGFIWLRTAMASDCCLHGNEPSGPIQVWQLLE